MIFQCFIDVKILTHNLYVTDYQRKVVTMPNITVAGITNAVDTEYVDTINLYTVVDIARNNTGDKGGI